MFEEEGRTMRWMWLGNEKEMAIKSVLYGAYCVVFPASFFLLYSLSMFY